MNWYMCYMSREKGGKGWGLTRKGERANVQKQVLRISSKEWLGKGGPISTSLEWGEGGGRYLRSKKCFQNYW